MTYVYVCVYVILNPPFICLYSTADSVAIPWPPKQSTSPDHVYSFEVMQGKVGIHTHQQHQHHLPVFEVWLEHIHPLHHQVQRKLIGYTAAVLPPCDEGDGDGEGAHNSSTASCTHTLPILNIHHHFQYTGCIEVAYLPGYASVYDLKRDMDYILQCMRPSPPSPLLSHQTRDGDDDAMHDDVHVDDGDDYDDGDGSMVSEDSLIDSPMKLSHKHVHTGEDYEDRDIQDDLHLQDDDGTENNGDDHGDVEAAHYSSTTLAAASKNDEMTHILDISIHSICDDVYGALVGEDVYSQHPIRGMYVCYTLTGDGGDGDGTVPAPYVVVNGDGGDGDGLGIVYGNKMNTLYWDAECMILNTTNRHLFSTTSSLLPDTLSLGLGVDANVGIKFLLIPASPEGDLPIYAHQSPHQTQHTSFHTQYLSPVATATLSCADLCAAITHVQSNRLSDYIISITLVRREGTVKVLPYTLPIKIAYRQQPVLVRSVQRLRESGPHTHIQSSTPLQSQDKLATPTRLPSPSPLPAKSTGMHFLPPTIAHPTRPVYIQIDHIRLLESILQNHHSVYMFSSIFYTVQVVYAQPEYNQAFEVRVFVHI